MSLPLLTYKGLWYSILNSPALQDGIGITGDCYQIINASQEVITAMVPPLITIININNYDLGTGTKSWINGMYIYYDGAVWQMIA